jgi:iron complex outermembrane receptor protein
MSSSLNRAQSLTVRLAIAALCAGTSTMPSIAAPANAAASEAAAEAGGLEEVIVTGTRQSGQTAAESPAPIQILSAEALKTASGSPDLMATLSQMVPSFTANASGGDTAGLTLQAKLRGLSPNHVLVLINGKRRHTTSNLDVNGTSPYGGGAGVDLNFIPIDAIDHIEVLTDGAAAQYGTDAIAGVINIILKKNSSGGSLSGTYGNYMNGGGGFANGGNTNDVSGNAGLEPMDGAYFNVTGETHGHGHSNVGAIDARVINPKNLATYPDSNMPSAPGYPYVNRASGDAEWRTKVFAVNTGFDFEGGTELYAFGTYGKKKADSYENYRMPHKVAYKDPTTGVTTYPLPFGFDPREAIDETDYSATVGVKGVVAQWNWDLSSTYGGDKMFVYTLETANAGAYAINGRPTPSDYYDGRLQTTQWTSTVDINRDFDVGMAGPLNVAVGGEYRRETYSIGAGIPLSYLSGGAQSYPGFTPSDAGLWSRKNQAGYIDLAAKPVEGLRLDAAGRFEHYSDFGDAKVGKLTARYDFNPQFAIRGTVSNGFRAPTLAEEYYASTNVGPTTAFAQLPPNSPGGKLLGLGTGLQPEHSINYSLGFVFRPLPRMSATLDVYQITVTNRIVGTGSIYGSVNGTPTPAAGAVNAAIAANGNQLDPDVVAHGSTGINVFANGIDTRTRGADLVFDFPVDYYFGHINWSIGATYNDTALTKVPGTPALLAGAQLYDQTALSALTTAAPKYVVNLGALWTYAKATVNLVEKVYGSSSEWNNDSGDNGPPAFTVCPYGTCNGTPAYYRTTIGVTPITNLDLAYQFKEHLKLGIGAINLFNRFPNKFDGTLRAHKSNFQYGDTGITQYPDWSPFGINGGFYYAKATFTF